jgi:hypothetical protein
MDKKLIFPMAVILIILSYASFAFSAPDVAPSPSKYGAVSSTASHYASKGRFSLDQDGILVIDYGKAYNNLGKWRNPFFIARYAHTLYREWYDSGCADNSTREKFLAQALFLLSSYNVGPKGMAYWPYPFKNTYFGAEAGWISGIGQSHIAGVLFRAFKITGEEKFAAAAEKAIKVYFYPTSSGGVCTEDEHGLWFQEVASPYSKPFSILNGHITALLGLVDYAQLTGDEEISKLANRGVMTIKNALHLFDAGCSSFYSLSTPDGPSSRPASRSGYHLLHIWQLERLYEISKDITFSQMAGLFKSYTETNETRIAKGSTNPETHGPSEAGNWYGNRYWSHSKFPTYYEVHMNGEIPIEGIFIGAHIQKAAPRSFAVSIYQDGIWNGIFKLAENKERDVFLQFDAPVYASAIRLDIESDNGNGNVALSSVMPIRTINTTVPAERRLPTVFLSKLAPGFREREDYPWNMK